MKKTLLRNRLGKEMSPEAQEFLSSLFFDVEMIEEDVWASMAHAVMLCEKKIISKKDLDQILSCLSEVEEKCVSGDLVFDQSLEDIHPNIEKNVEGGKLHTARSRNDQVATDTRMHARSLLLQTVLLVLELSDELLLLARNNAKKPVPGYTHLQHAQPTSFGFLFSAYSEALGRDVERLKEAYRRTNLCPLGSCAFAGTSFNIDRGLTADLLGFDGVLENALDAVASRDFVLDSLFALSVLASNLSRFAEDLVLFSSKEFGMVELDDAFSSVSSIMPHKKNPDTLELARAKTGDMYGALVRVLTVLKALPFSYNRDLQNDREDMWRCFYTMGSVLRVLRGAFRSLKINYARAKELLEDFGMSVELANFLVREQNIGFRKAHNLVGELVRKHVEKGSKTFDLDFTSAYLKVAKSKLSKVLDVSKSLGTYRSQGSANPGLVKKSVTAQLALNDSEKKWVLAQSKKLKKSFEKTHSFVPKKKAVEKKP